MILEEALINSDEPEDCSFHQKNSHTEEAARGF